MVSCVFNCTPSCHFFEQWISSTCCFETRQERKPTEISTFYFQFSGHLPGRLWLPVRLDFFLSLVPERDKWHRLFYCLSCHPSSSIRALKKTQSTNQFVLSSSTTRLLTEGSSHLPTTGKIKGKGIHTHNRVLGLELISLYRQSARRWL